MVIKIFHVISSLTRGGRERQLSTIIFNTDQEKHPSKIIYFNASENHYFDEYKLHDFSIKITAKKFRRRLAELNHLIITEKPDLIFTWGNLESVFILLLKPFHQFKFINGSVRHGIRSQKLSHYFRTIILHLSGFIVANSKAGLKANHLNRGYVLYNGIDNKFIGKLSKEEKIKKRNALLNIDPKSTLLISVANLVPYKDYDTILRALKGLKKEKYRFNYLILGNGPLRQSVEQKIREYNLTENISILGTVQNVPEFLQLSDIFIHSSKGEGCSNAILEAMAAGLPIIASNTGGTPEIVNTMNGFLFEYGDFMKLKALIRSFFQHPEMAEKLGQSSIEQVKKKFTINTMMKNYYQILENITGRQDDPI